MAQHHSNIGHPQAPRYDYHIDEYGNTTATRLFDREQAPAQHIQLYSSRHDVPINETIQHRQQRANTDQASSSTYTQRAAPSAQQTKSSNQLAPVRGDVRERNESHQHLPSSSRHHTATRLTGEEEHQRSSQSASENNPRNEDMEVLTPGMNKLPTPCWEDGRLMIPLVREQLAQEAFLTRQEQRLNHIWGMYGEEREALAAAHTPEPEEAWTPALEEEEEVLERETPLWDEIWERSVLGGEAQMRDILGEDENWPREEPEEPDIWTRDTGGMLRADVLRQFVHVFALEEKVRHERLERDGTKAGGIR